MKVEVGMYVRIQWGYGEQTISKCTNKFDMGDTQYSKNDFYIHTDKKEEVIYKSMILKARNNIIDLIQEGDYVNGKEVVSKHYHKKWYLTLDTISNKISDNEISEEDIKSIVTKEQFKANEYVVE